MNTFNWQGNEYIITLLEQSEGSSMVTIRAFRKTENGLAGINVNYLPHLQKTVVQTMLIQSMTMDDILKSMRPDDRATKQIETEVA